jgi:hypothetical protein
MARTDHRRTRFLVVLLVFLTACGGGSGPSAEKVAIRWRQALEKGDYATAWDLYAPGHRPGPTKAEGEAFLRKVQLGKPLSPERAAVSIKAVRTGQNPDGAGVRVYLQVNTKDATQSHQEAVDLLKVDANWGVTGTEPFVSPPGQP